VGALAVDLNSDIGEGFGRWSLGDDTALLQVITSANVACGFHAGDPSIMRRVCAAAAEVGVVIGAHVGYRDPAGFGRRFIEIEPTELLDDVVYQVAALDGFARMAGTSVRYVKPHGALYAAIVAHTEQAAAVVEAIQCYDARLPILGLPGSEVLRLASEAGVTTVTEAFADRAYTHDGRLISRRQPHAIIHDPEEVQSRCVRIITEGTIETIEGGTVPIHAESICVHGDTPDAATIVRVIRRGLLEAGVALQPFA
jgi:UPF0271 protein